MKKAGILTRSLFSAAVCTFLITAGSCKQDPKPDDTKEAAEEANEAKFEEPKEDDSAFLVAAAETDLAEIEIGNLAMTRGTSQHVKDFGKMLVADHTKSANETKPFAQKLNITLPSAITEKGKEHLDELNGEKTGVDFDKKFADMMVDGHEDAISKMEKASRDANDPEIRTWATNMVPTLKTHLEHAKMLQEELK